jgi:hypothetical protein
MPSDGGAKPKTKREISMLVPIFLNVYVHVSLYWSAERKQTCKMVHVVRVCVSLITACNFPV